MQDKSYAEAVASSLKKSDSCARLASTASLASRAGLASQVGPTAVDRSASLARPAKQHSPLGFSTCPPPGLASMANQQQALTQAVVGQVNAILARFEQSFEKRLSQVEAQTPRKHPQCPLRGSTLGLRRIDDFSSRVTCQ